MAHIRGPAEICYDDGTRFSANVDITLTETRGIKSGRGTIEADDLLAIGMKDGMPILTCGALKIRVIITSTSSSGTGTLVTSGAPL